MIELTRWKDVRAAATCTARATVLRDQLAAQLAGLSTSRAIDHPDWRDADTRARYESIECDSRGMTARRIERMITHLDAAIAGEV